MDAGSSCVAQRTRAKTMEKVMANYLEMKKMCRTVDSVMRKDDVVILDDCHERKGKIKSKISNATRAVKRKRGDEDKEEELNPETRRGRKVKRDPVRLDDAEETDSDVRRVSKVSVPLSDKSKREPNGFHGDEGTDSDIEILSEEFFPVPPKRGRSDENKATRVGGRDRSEENRISERGNTGESGSEQLSIGTMKEGMIIGTSESSDSDFSSSGDEEDDSDCEENSGSSSDMLSNSDGLSHCKKDFIGGKEEKDGTNISPEERKDHNVDDDESSPITRTEQNLKEQEHGFKRIRRLGLDIWINSNERDNGKQQRRSICLRPRSVPESRKKKLKLGTYSQPLPVKENEDCDSSDKDAGYSEPVADSSNCDLSDEDGGYSEPVAKTSKRSYKKVEKLSKRRAPKSKPLDIKKAINILVNSILGEGEEEGGVNDILSPDEEKPPAQKELPLKFRFEDEDPAPPEKEEWEKEIDNLFAELEMSLILLDTDANTSSKTDENIHATSKTLSPGERCRLEDHPEMILEEPTGIICKCCHRICVEMKDIFPDLIIPTPEKRDLFNCGRGGCSDFGDIHVDDSSCEKHEKHSAYVQTEGPVLDLIPVNIRMSMYRHQLDGFEFLWKNVVGETSIEKLKSYSSTDGSGCIISHAPGTGKTCLSIVFITSLMKIYPNCRPVIVAPKSMLLTWKHEFEKWDFGFPFHNLNGEELAGDGNEAAGLDSLVSRVPNDKQVRRHLIRVAKLYSWAKQTSVLGLSYNLFEKLVNGPENGGINEGKVRNILLELPGLLVLDEGHTPRNKRSHMWKALTKVKTRRRVILSGTPFQNTLDELYNTLSLVNPELSKSKLRRNSLTDTVYERNEDSIAKLKAMIDPFVHVHKGTILQESLPGLKDMLVILRPTIQQESALKLVSDKCSQFDKVHLVSLVTVHPSLVAAKKELLLHKTGQQGLLDSCPNSGVKTKFVMELVKLCDALNEKVLIFSEYIDPLSFIKEQLKFQFSWIEGKQVLYMDGKQKADHRQSSIDSLNAAQSEVKVFLASTRACSEGINLVGASRVVLLDVVWNPSVERQAISRAYRLGQTKIVYVYHLITGGTLEVSKYARQSEKHRLSELVFSCRDRESKKENISAAVAEDKILEAMIDNSNNNLNGMFEEIIHNPKESNLFENFSFVEMKN